MAQTVTGLAARERAHTVLHEILDRGTPLDDALKADRRLARLDERDRAFARNLVATTLRRLGQIDALIDARLKRPLPVSASAARNAMRLGICQLLFMDTGAHAAVDTSVRLAAARGPERFKGLVNGILRGLARAGADALAGQDAERLNTPDWLWQSWAKAYGDETCRRIAAAHLAVPPLDLTVRGDAEATAAKLGGRVLPGGTVRLEAAGAVAALPGYAEGAWWIQDAAAALPARLLLGALPDPAAARIADLCAAPGGKTAQLAAAGARVVAVDSSADRLAVLRENMARLALDAEIVEADATAWSPEEKFDAVLVDAPCSATGTIRRHPDIPWLKSARDAPRATALQTRLAAAAARLSKPGGTIVYSVCSLQPEEGPAIVDALLAARPDVVRAPIRPEELAGLPVGVTEAGDVRTLPCHLAEAGGMDGFHIARLARTG